MSLEVNSAYQEILKLDRMLTEAGIPHETRQAFDGYQVFYPAQQGCIMDAVEHSWSYGHVQDLLEIMGLLTPEEEIGDKVRGYLTAKDIFNRVATHWRESQEDGGKDDE